MRCRQDLGVVSENPNAEGGHCGNDLETFDQICQEQSYLTRIDSLVQAHSQNKLHQDSSQEPATTNNLSIQSLLLKYNENQLQNFIQIFLLLYSEVVF